METITKLMPECPLHCVATALINSTCLADPTPSCICANQDFNDAATLCIRTMCSVRDGLTAQNLTNNLCDRPAKAHRLTYPTLPISATFLILAGITVIMRVYSRYHMRASLWWDDACDLLAILFCVAFVTVNMHMINISGGFDLWAVHFDYITEFLVGTYISIILYMLGRTAIRFSIILFYMRIFRIHVAATLLRIFFVVNILFGFSATAALVFQCTPINFFWNRWDGEHSGHCVSGVSLIWACAGIAFVMDLALIVLPIPFITRLNLSWQKKVQTCVMFAIGSAVLVVSGFRFSTLTKFASSENPTMDSMETGLLSALELEIGIICACLPSIQVLFRIMVNRLSMMTQSALGNSSSYHARDDLEAKGIQKPAPVRYPRGVIRLTTTIRQDMPYTTASEEYLQMEDMSPDGKVAVMLGSAKKGTVKAEAWA